MKHSPHSQGTLSAVALAKVEAHQLFGEQLPKLLDELKKANAPCAAISPHGPWQKSCVCSMPCANAKSPSVAVRFIPIRAPSAKNPRRTAPNLNECEAELVLVYPERSSSHGTGTSLHRQASLPRSRTEEEAQEWHALTWVFRIPRVRAAR